MMKRIATAKNAEAFQTDDGYIIVTYLGSKGDTISNAVLPAVDEMFGRGMFEVVWPKCTYGGEPDFLFSMKFPAILIEAEFR